MGDFFGVAQRDREALHRLPPVRAACGWSAIYIDPPREALKKRLYQSVELLETAETAAG